MYTFSIHRPARVLRKTWLFEAIATTTNSARINLRSLFNVGALLIGCDGPTTRPMLSLDSSFVGGDGSVFNDDARTAPGDGDQSHAVADGSVVDAQTMAAPDATVLRDLGALMDQSPADDDASQDAAVGDDGDAAVSLPVSCGDIPFIDMNDHALDGEPAFSYRVLFAVIDFLSVLQR